MKLIGSFDAVSRRKNIVFESFLNCGLTIPIFSDKTTPLSIFVSCPCEGGSFLISDFNQGFWKKHAVQIFYLGFFL